MGTPSTQKVELAMNALKYGQRLKTNGTALTDVEFMV
jgi:hypothetical protein